MPEFSQQKTKDSKSKKVDTTSRLHSSNIHKRTEHPLFAQQEILGNQAVQHLLQSKDIQPKLKVSSQDDKYEREADRIAEIVAGTSQPTNVLQDSNMKTMSVLEKPVTGSNYTRASSLHQGIREVIQSESGRPLDTVTRESMEAKFGGYDFSQVRLHTDGKAAESARAVNALAYTVGRDVVFGRGLYSPVTTAGQRLLAHELTHVVQQTQHKIDGKIEDMLLYRKNQSETTGISIRRSDIEQMAKDLYTKVRNSKSVGMIKANVESNGPSFLERLGADAVVISLSGAGGYILGVGTGVEAIYSPSFGWKYFWQWGLGAVFPAGGGAALEVGFLWDLKNPSDYEGQFIEVAFTAGPGKISGPKGVPLPGVGSISGSVTPEDLIFYPITEGEMKKPRGFKFGAGYGVGSKWQIAILSEWYYQILETEPLEGETIEESFEHEPTPEKEVTESEVISKVQREFIQHLKERELIYDFEDKVLPKIYQRERSRIMNWILRDLKAGRRQFKIVSPEGYTIPPRGWVEYNWWECMLNTEEDVSFNVRGYTLYQKKQSVTLSEAKVETWNFISVNPPCPYFRILYDRSLQRFLRKRSSQAK